MNPLTVPFTHGNAERAELRADGRGGPPRDGDACLERVAFDGLGTAYVKAPFALA